MGNEINISTLRVVVVTSTKYYLNTGFKTPKHIKTNFKKEHRKVNMKERKKRQITGILILTSREKSCNTRNSITLL